MHEDYWKVLEEIRDDPYPENGFTITKIHRMLEGQKLNVFVVNPLFDARLNDPTYTTRCIPVDGDGPLEAVLQDLPWSPAERRKRVGRKLERALTAATSDAESSAGVDSSLAVEAAHGLWELAVERRHHPGFSEDMLRAVVSGLSCPTWEVASCCAGAVWQLARTADLRRRLVDAGVVSALQTLMRRSVHAPAGRDFTGDARVRIQDVCAGCMGVLMVDKKARRALFGEYPNTPDLIALSSDNPAGDAPGLEAAAVVVQASVGRCGLKGTLKVYLKPPFQLLKL